MPISRSTSPTLISWRTKSSPRKMSTAKFRPCPPALKPNARGTQLSAPVTQINSDPPQAKPVKLIWSQCEQIRQLPDPGKQVPSEHFNWDVSLVPLQIQLDCLCRARKIVHHQHFLSAQLAGVCQHSVIRGVEEFNESAAKHLK